MYIIATVGAFAVTSSIALITIVTSMFASLTALEISFIVQVDVSHFVLYYVALNFKKNRTNFTLGDKFLPVFKHGFLRSEKMLITIISNTRWCISVGVSCNFMNTYDVV